MTTDPAVTKVWVENMEALELKPGFKSMILGFGDAVAREKDEQFKKLLNKCEALDNYDKPSGFINKSLLLKELEAKR